MNNKDKFVVDINDMKVLVYNTKPKCFKLDSSTEYPLCVGSWDSCGSLNIVCERCNLYNDMK